MELAVYRASQYTSALEAFAQGGVHKLRTLFQEPITLEMLEQSGSAMEHDFHIAVESAEKSFECAGDDSYRFIIMDSIPRFEQDRDGASEVWQKIDTFDYECETSSDHLLALKCNIHLLEEGNGCFTVIVTDVNGNHYYAYNIQVGNEYDIVLDGETFDFRLKHSDVDGYWLDIFNLVNDGEEVRTNYEFEFYKYAEIASADYFLKHMIAHELDQIEKWSGEAYCGPNVNGAGSEGDEIYQALYNIRKIIGIGVEKYTTLYYPDR